MILQGLKINMQYLDEVFDSEFEKKEAVAHERLRTIKDHDIIRTRLRYSSCKCESRGLRAGMTVDALIRMGCGCSDPWWVCPRLASLRRLYDH